MPPRPEDPPKQPAERSAQPAESSALPVRSTDETDTGWGDRLDRDDDSRLLEDRPPHWDDV